MKQPLVSIILPVYNAQSHLARCLSSICAQTYQNLEIIVLNDGSKDQSLPVCEEFRKKDSRIILVDKANSGVSDTRNLGLKLATGEYIQFVDSDDYIDPDYTGHLVAAAEEHHADLVIAPYKMVIPAGASKPEQVLEKLEDELGVMTVARPPEVREYGFLPAGVYDKDHFALRLMDKPASYFYSVLWNKLYRRILLTGNDICFTSEGGRPCLQHAVYPVRGSVCRHRHAGVLLCAEPSEHLPHPDQPGHHRAEQITDVPLLQRSLHPARDVRGGTAPAVQVPRGHCREHLPLRAVQKGHRRGKGVLARPQTVTQKASDPAVTRLSSAI